MNENLMDLKISGSRTMPGGKYRDVKIGGSGKIEGDLECNSLKISGSGSMNGNIKSGIIAISGSSSFNGQVEAEEFKVAGSTLVKGNLKVTECKIGGSTTVKESIYAGNLNIYGSLKVDGAVKGEEVNIYGSLSSKEGFECERLFVSGAFKTEGLVNADQVIIELGGRTRAKEIGGQSIRVQRGKIKKYNNVLLDVIKSISSMFSLEGDLEAEVIEGDEVYLEDTKAKVVRGNKITIGKNCVIDKVEYKEEFNILDNGEVKENKKF